MTGFTIVKLVAGAGTFLLPSVFWGFGWLASTIGLIFLASCCAYCVALSILLKKKLPNSKNQAMHSTVEAILKPLYPTLSTILSKILLVFEMSAPLGIMAVYVSFMAEMMTQSIHCLPKVFWILII
eukprot:TRINITY_DN1529_c0_g2_i1.p1 TRINITY_DN1529_c0_g2~~TRINITY_DN1529_c0_g2_i1.p1  ORF type:complete len:126 (+),score=0.77 TRINITY_DN1529_c0_g2_i1:49-426(+)